MDVELWVENFEFRLLVFIGCGDVLDIDVVDHWLLVFGCFLLFGTFFLDLFIGIGDIFLVFIGFGRLILFDIGLR